MRKFFGGLLGLLSMYFLFLAYAQMARAETAECASELAKKIVELEEKDQSGILKLQRQITYLKLAEQTIASGSKTAEDYIRKQEAVLKKLDEKSDVIERLVELYQSSGASGRDRTIALGRLEETLAKTKKASYWKPVTRFKNEELSAYVLAHTMVHGEKSPYQERDAAILWMDSEISEGVEKVTHRGSASANLTEASSWVVRFTGVIKNSYSAEELRSAIEKAKKLLDAEMDRITDLFRSELAKSCAELKNCADCKIDSQAKESALMQAIELVKKKYLEDPKYKDRRVQERILSEAQQKKIELEAEGVSVPLPESRAAPELFKKDDTPKLPEKTEELPVGETIRNVPVSYNGCEVRLTFTRNAIVSDVEDPKSARHFIYVSYRLKSPKTGKTYKGSYFYKETKGALVKDIWRPHLSGNDAMKKACPASIAQ